MCNAYFVIFACILHRFFFAASPYTQNFVSISAMASAPSFDHPFQLCKSAELQWQVALTPNCAPERKLATASTPDQAVTQLQPCLSMPRQAPHSSSMHNRTAPPRPPIDITAVEVAPLAPMFARGSAYVPFVLLLLLLLLRQVSVAPLLAVTVVVTLLMWLMNCGSVFQYL